MHTHTIYKNRKTGYWHLNARIDGRRLRPSLHTKDRRSAQIEADLRMKELSPNSPTSRKNVYDLLDLYQAYSLARGKSKYTLDNEDSIVRVFKSLVKDRPLDRFDEVAAGKFFEALVSRTRPVLIGHDTVQVLWPITGRGKNYYLRALRTIWNTGIGWKLVETNVFNGVKKFDVVDAPPRILTDDEIVAVFQALKNRFPHMIDVMLFLLLTGMRRNEALALEWVDIDGRQATIARAKQRKHRKVPLFRIPREILEARRKRKLARPFSDSCTGSTLSHDFADAVTDAGIQHAKLHDLRKTFGTMLARNNVNPYTIMAWLGHANADVTLTHYIGMDTETADRLDGVGAELAARIFALIPQKRGQLTVNSAPSAKTGNKKAPIRKD